MSLEPAPSSDAAPSRPGSLRLIVDNAQRRIEMMRVFRGRRLVVALGGASVLAALVSGITALVSHLHGSAVVSGSDGASFRTTMLSWMNRSKAIG